MKMDSNFKLTEKVIDDCLAECLEKAADKRTSPERMI